MLQCSIHFIHSIKCLAFHHLIKQFSIIFHFNIFLSIFFPSMFFRSTFINFVFSTFFLSTKWRHTVSSWQTWSNRTRCMDIKWKILGTKLDRLSRYILVSLICLFFRRCLFIFLRFYFVIIQIFAFFIFLCIFVCECDLKSWIGIIYSENKSCTNNHNRRLSPE